MRAMLICLLVIGLSGCGSDDAGMPEQPVSTPTAEKPVDDPTLAVKTPDVASVENPLPVAKFVGDPIENHIGMVLVPIPAGEFMMGSPESEEGRHPRETQHRVTLTKSFHLGRTEVTQGQWKAVMRTGPMGAGPWKDGVWGLLNKEYVKEGDNYAATYVSWEDAVEFCRRLSEQEGVEYRLPTEAEWEYASRAGTTTKYSFGDDESQLGEYAWYRENAMIAGESSARIVSQKKPNPWGLYDMHGNMFEWCQDWAGEYPSGDVTDPVGPDSGSRRVIRGGCWLYDAGTCRSAFRHRRSPSRRFRNSSLGFRVLRCSDE